jgi:hypothetical protein
MVGHGRQKKATAACHADTCSLPGLRPYHCSLLLRTCPVPPPPCPCPCPPWLPWRTPCLGSLVRRLGRALVPDAHALGVGLLLGEGAVLLQLLDAFELLSVLRRGPLQAPHRALLAAFWPDYYRNPCICNRWPFSSARGSGARVTLGSCHQSVRAEPSGPRVQKQSRPGPSP